MRPPRLLFPVLLALLIPAVPCAGQIPTPNDPSRVLILYDQNEADSNRNNVGDSEEIARLYAGVRNVPAANLLGLDISIQHYYYSGSTAWAQIWKDMIQPLQAKLVKLGTDNIDTILLSFGVPYRFNIPGATSFATRAIDNFISVPFSLGTETGHTLPSSWWGNTYFESSPGRLPDQGRFNHKTHSFGGKPLYLVSRLDGPAVDAARELIEGARYAEQYLSPLPGHYNGFGYVDTRYGLYSSTLLDGYPFGYGSYSSADKCIAFGKRFIETSGLALKWETTGKEIGETGAVYHDSTPAQTASRAMFYTGWYNYRAYHDVWNWLPGSVACDLNSNSIQNFHTTYDKAFLTMAFSRGLSAGAGVIAEPYLSGHYRPEVLLYFLLQGYTWAEAASLSNPALGWVCVQIGDPLYSPFRAGRKPVQDTWQPPAPRLSVEVEAGGTARVVADLDTLGREPDLVTAKVVYGTTPVPDTTVPHDSIYRVRKPVMLTSLTSDTLYYYRVEVRDPAGLTTGAGPSIFFSTPAEPVRAHIHPTQVLVKSGSPFTLNFTFKCKPDLSHLDALRIDLIDEQTRKTYDATPLVLIYHSTYLTSADLDTLTLWITLPAVLPPGKYTFKTTVSQKGKNHIAASTVTLQAP